MRANRWPAWLAGMWTLGLLSLAGCGPGVGGTGTGAAAFEAFEVSAAPVCGGSIATELICPQPPVGAGPNATGTQPVRFVDDTGQVTLDVNGNLAILDAACLRLHFSGEFAAGAAGAEGFFGGYEVAGSGMSVLAALSAVPVAGGGSISIVLRDVNGRAVVGPLALRRATTGPSAPGPC